MSKKSKPKPKHKPKHPEPLEKVQEPPPQEPDPPPQEQPPLQEPPPEAAPLLSITCPHCQQVVQTQDQAAMDNLVTCPSCGGAIKEANA